MFVQNSKDLLLAAETRGGATFVFQDIQKKVVRALQEAEKDNNFIYHAKIPELTSLASIGKAAVAKSTPLSGNLSSSFKGKSGLSKGESDFPKAESGFPKVKSGLWLIC